jgi:hypothetical protein
LRSHGRLGLSLNACLQKETFDYVHIMTVAVEHERKEIASSSLLAKLRGLGIEIPLDLERLAFARGCTYYERELPPRSAPLGDVPVSNAELAIALITPSIGSSARNIRLAAALLGGEGVDAGEVASLARRENCAEVVRYIAECGRSFEPENNFWRSLLENLPIGRSNVEFPHPTRFVEMTGIDRGKVGLFTRWIRPRAAKPV